MREIVLNGVVVNDESPCYVIAEIGNNHQGDVEQAKALIDMAVLCGASAVKFQKRDNANLFTKEMWHRPYPGRDSFGPTYGKHREAVELSAADFGTLAEYASTKGITFFATPFDPASADLLRALSVPFFKIASGDLANTPLLEHVARFGKPLIVSTGGASLADVDRALAAILPINPRVAVLHCVSSYPARFSDLNLRVIATYRERYPDLVIGYSGHEPKSTAAVAAYALGARIIEKHITLDHDAKGTDQGFSLNGEELRELVGRLLLTHEALGDGVKRHLEAEAAPMLKLAKSLYTTRALPAGHILTPADVAIKCPGGGLPPYQLANVVGCRLTVALGFEDAIPLAALEPVAESVPEALVVGV